MEEDTTLLSQIWKDAEAAALELKLAEERKQTDDFGDEYVAPPDQVQSGFCDGEEPFEEWLVEDEAITNARYDAKWSLGHSSLSLSDLRYPKTATSTFIGARYTPYSRMSTLQRTHMRISKDNRESCPFVHIRQGKFAFDGPRLQT